MDERQRNPDKLRLPSLADAILDLCTARENEPRQDLRHKMDLEIQALQRESDRRSRIYVLEEKATGK